MPRAELALKLEIKLGDDADDEDEKEDLLDRARDDDEPGCLVGWKIDLGQWMGGEGIIVGVKEKEEEEKYPKLKVKKCPFEENKQVLVAQILRKTKKRKLVPDNFLEFNPQELKDASRYV